MENTKVKTEAKPKSKSEQKVEQILEVLRNKNIKLSMLEYSELVTKLVRTHRVKPTFIEENTELSLPHIYNLISLGGMTPMMKDLITSGKIKATDALKILRRAKTEAEFIMYAHELSSSKVDHRKRADYGKPNPAKGASKPKPKPNPMKARKEKVKKLIVEILGKDAASDKTKVNTIRTLVDQLMTR